MPLGQVLLDGSISGPSDGDQAAARRLGLHPHRRHESASAQRRLCLRTISNATSGRCGGRAADGAGNCVAVGYGGAQGFVLTERHGRWGKATGLPGLAALNTGRQADVIRVSCASAGNCAAIGYYT